MRRLLWLVVGVGAGFAVGMQFLRSARKTKERYAPSSVASRATGRAKGLRDRVREAVEEGRSEMFLREAELRSELGLDP